MKPPSEKQAGAEIVEVLADLLGSSPKKIRATAAVKDGCDYLVSAPNHRFLVEYKVSASAGPLAVAVTQLQKYVSANQDQGLPLLVVPFMGRVGRELCDQADLSWLDLSGNAKIIVPGLRIRVEGRPNKFTDRGRPPNIFAAKSSRVARQLLLTPKRFQTQAELARQSGLGDGYVSKIVRRLEQEQYLDINDDGAARPRDPDVLPDAWLHVYDFNRHHIIKGHVSARSGDELIQRTAKALSREKLEYAATGLSSAWLLTNFAAFRLVTVYLPAVPSRSFLKQIEFSDEPKGANLWLVIPDDEGVFHGGHKHGGIECVSPVQTYLDLKAQPERAKDAAVELRRKLLNWGKHGT